MKLREKKSASKVRIDRSKQAFDQTFLRGLVRPQENLLILSWQLVLI